MVNNIFINTAINYEERYKSLLKYERRFELQYDYINKHLVQVSITDFDEILPTISPYDKTNISKATAIMNILNSHYFFDKINRKILIGWILDKKFEILSDFIHGLIKGQCAVKIEEEYFIKISDLQYECDVDSIIRTLGLFPNEYTVKKDNYLYSILIDVENMLDNDITMNKLADWSW